MKKIKINYDLIEKINESKNGIRLHKIVKNRAFTVAFTLGILSPFYIVSSAKSNLLSLLYVLGVNATLSGLDFLIEKKFKKTTEASASLKLLLLTLDLYKLDVKTTLELLQDAKVIQTNYKFNFEDGDKLPTLKQEKYIEIPLSNGYTETLLQEHNIGSKEYEISVNEPVKKMDYKPAKTTI